MTRRRRYFFVLLFVVGLVAVSGLIIANKSTKLGLDLKGGVELVRRHVLRDRDHDDEIDGILRHLLDVLQRAHADFGVGRKARDQPAAHAGSGLGEIEQAAGIRHAPGRQRLAAGIVQHHRVGRGDVADDVPRNDLEMQVAMQLARIDRMRGIVIVDPFIHSAASGKTGFQRGTGDLVMR